jgi:hypothetical protein
MPIYTYSTLNDPAALFGTYAIGINDSGQADGLTRLNNSS